MGSMCFLRVLPAFIDRIEARDMHILHMKETEIHRAFETVGAGNGQRTVSEIMVCFIVSFEVPTSSFIR